MMETTNSNLSERIFEFTSFNRYSYIGGFLFCFLFGLFFFNIFFETFDFYKYGAIILCLLCFYRSWTLLKTFKQQNYFVRVNEKGMTYAPKSKSPIYIQWEEISNIRDYSSGLEIYYGTEKPVYLHNDLKDFNELKLTIIERCPYFQRAQSFREKFTSKMYQSDIFVLIAVVFLCGVFVYLSQDERHKNYSYISIVVILILAGVYFYLSFFRMTREIRITNSSIELISIGKKRSIPFEKITDILLKKNFVIIQYNSKKSTFYSGEYKNAGIFFYNSLYSAWQKYKNR